MSETAIHSKRIITPNGIIEATIFIKDGLIESIIEGELKSHSYHIIDVGNLVVMPGVIDPHVHINEPGRTEWEGFVTATRGCALGRSNYFS